MWGRSVVSNSIRRAQGRMQFCGPCPLRRMERRPLRAIRRQIARQYPAPAGIALPRFRATQFIVPHDQALAAGMPATHGDLRDFFRTGKQPASAGARLLLAFRHQQGRYCCGPYLENRNAGCVRRVCFRRRDFAGSILSRRRSNRRHAGRELEHRRVTLSGVLILTLPPSPSPRADRS